MYKFLIYDVMYLYCNIEMYITTCFHTLTPVIALMLSVYRMDWYSAYIHCNSVFVPMGAGPYKTQFG